MLPLIALNSPIAPKEQNGERMKIIWRIDEMDWIKVPNETKAGDIVDWIDNQCVIVQYGNELRYKIKR
jgi:hypothetical protein